MNASSVKPLFRNYQTWFQRRLLPELASRAKAHASPLPDLLPRHPRLLLEGQPGAGKTTFLRFTASMLARDVL